VVRFFKSGRPRKIIRDAKSTPQKAVPTKSGLGDAHNREEPASEGRLYKSKTNQRAQAKACATKPKREGQAPPLQMLGRRFAYQFGFELLVFAFAHAFQFTKRPAFANEKRDAGKGTRRERDQP